MSHEPAQNHLLSSLTAAAWQRMLPHLEWVELHADAVLYEAGVTLRHVYFPATATVSLVASMQDGGSAEVAVVGNEGMVGICAFMGGGPSMSRAVVRTAGHGLRMTACAISAASTDSAPVMQALLRYTQALFAQMAQNSACNRHHTLDQRLCRWLLAHHDRAIGDELLATHDDIADLLGVRREGVTAGALKLQSAGLIRYNRGHVSILDRSGLKAISCECHAVIENAYGSLRDAAPVSVTPEFLTA